MAPFLLKGAGIYVLLRIGHLDDAFSGVLYLEKQEAIEAPC